MTSNLKEVLNFKDVFFISLGYIVGAGIYSLLYITTSYSKSYTWLSFIIGGIISLMTAFSYRDLSEYFDTNASDYDYITRGISHKLKYPISYLLILLGIITTTVLTIAFTNIFKETFNIKLPYFVILIISLTIPTLINIYDVKATSNVNMGISITETSVLILLIIFSFYKKKLTSNIIPDLSISKIYDKIPKIIHGAFLTVFAYSGFETIPKLAKETRNSSKNIPKAIIWSLTFTIILYTLVSLSVNNLLGVENVSKTKNPISLAYKVLLGNISKPFIDTITLFSIFNTIMLTILFSSRQLQALSEKKIFPEMLTDINKITKTPIKAIITIVILVIAFCILTNINTSSHIVNLLLFLLFVLINISNIILNKKQVIKRKTPYYSYFGLVSTLCILYSMISSKIKIM